MSSLPIIFYTIPIIFVLFLIKSRQSMTHRIDTIIEDSLNSGIIQMIIIFILAGAFANTLAGMGSIEVLKSLIYYASNRSDLLGLHNTRFPSHHR
jgi:Na+/H+ antiporter NhaC